MHIGLVIYDHLDLISGGYLYNRQLVDYWRAAGHQVTLYALPARGYWRHYGDNFRPAWLNRLLTAPLDVLVQDELNHPSLFILNRWLRRRVTYPIVGLIHLLRCSEPHPAAARRYYEMIERRYLGGLDGWICNSQDTADLVGRVSRQPLPSVVAYPGRDHWSVSVGERVFEPDVDQHGVTRILYVGNLIQRKGLHVLLAGLTLLKECRWRLTIVGRHDLEPAYAAGIATQIEHAGLSGRVSMLGPKRYSEMPHIYQTHDLFVMPSFYEPFGIVYLEAMGAGLPIIASRAGAGPELVRHGENGFLVRPESATDVADAIRAALGNRTRLAEMGSEARRRYERHPTWAETGETVTAFLESLIR